MENSSASSFESLSTSFYSNCECGRKGSYKYRSSRFSRFEESSPYFLGSCHLCKKNLGDGRDIYMYRGDTPFCSEECRRQQIKTDEKQEMKNKLTNSSAVKAQEKRSDKSDAISSESDLARARTAAAAAAMAC